MCVSVDLSSAVYHNVSKKDKKLIILKADFNKLNSDKIFDIVTDLLRDDISKTEAIDMLLNLLNKNKDE